MLVLDSSARRAMFFECIDFSHEHSADQTPRVTLLRDRLWNDHGFRTRYAATLHVSGTESVSLGDVKILQQGRRHTALPTHFESLSSEYLSLGQSESYYQGLQELGDAGDEILLALQDITHPSVALDPSANDGVELSLLRFPSARKLFADRKRVSPSDTLSFRYRYHFRSFSNQHSVEFSFDRRSPLGRVNVMVGENASGKTSVLGRLAFALAGTPALDEVVPNDLGFAPILAVSFSPFDNFRRPDHSDPLYDYIGLRKHAAGEQVLELDMKGAFDRLDLRADEIRKRLRVDQWRGALQACQIDPEITTTSEKLSSRMLHLSAGQKFAVFVFTNLVAKLESRAMSCSTNRSSTPTRRCSPG